jgi:hypothetical protein
LVFGARQIPPRRAGARITFKEPAGGMWGILNKEIIIPQSLMDDAGTYYTNLVGLGSWKLESIKHAQIIALTTQLSKHKTKILSLTKMPLISHQKDLLQISLLHLPRITVTLKLGALSKLTTMLNSIWLKRATKSIIGATSTSIRDLISKGCYAFHKPTDHDAWKTQ